MRAPTRLHPFNGLLIAVAFGTACITPPNMKPTPVVLAPKAKAFAGDTLLVTVVDERQSAYVQPAEGPKAMHFSCASQGPSKPLPGDDFLKTVTLQGALVGASVTVAAGQRSEIVVSDTARGWWR